MESELEMQKVLLEKVLKRTRTMHQEINAITHQGEYEIAEEPDHEDVAQIVSHL
jgi:hypothetical protein